MPTVFYSTSGDNSDGSSFAKAYTTLSNAMTQAGASGSVMIDSASAETATSTALANLASPGTTPATAVRLIVVDKSTGLVSSGATVTVSSGVSFSYGGFFTVEGGLSFVGGAGSTPSGHSFGGSTNGGVDFGPGVKFTMSGTGSNSNYALGASSTYNQKQTFRGSDTSREPKLKFSASTQTCYSSGGNVIFRKTVAVDPAGAVPASFINFLNGRTLICDAEATDFTGIGATLVTLGGAFAQTGSLILSSRECAFPAGLTTLLSGGFIPQGTRISLARCSIGGGVLSDRLLTEFGWQAEDTTTTLQGGATNGATLRSWHMSTSVTGSMITGAAVFTPSLATPFESQPMLIYNEQTGSQIIVAVEVIVAGSAAPTNAEIWLEVEELASATSSLATVMSNGLVKSTDAPVSHPVSAATWNTSSGTFTKVQLQVAVTAQAKGMLKGVVKIARSNADYNVDPKLIVSGGPAVSRSWVLPSGAMMNETTAVQTNTVIQPVPVGRRSSFR